MVWQSMTLELNASDDRGIDIVKQVFNFFLVTYQSSVPVLTFFIKGNQRLCWNKNHLRVWRNFSDGILFAAF
jgi:hypothetical protein